MEQDSSTPFDAAKMYQNIFERDFDYWDVDVQNQAMNIVRRAHNPLENVTYPELQSQLADGMFVVGGNNDIAINQLNTLVCTYETDRDYWNERLEEWEIQQQAE